MAALHTELCSLSLFQTKLCSPCRKLLLLPPLPISPLFFATPKAPDCACHCEPFMPHMFSPGCASYLSALRTELFSPCQVITADSWGSVVARSMFKDPSEDKGETSILDPHDRCARATSGLPKHAPTYTRTSTHARVKHTRRQLRARAHAG